MPSNLWPGKSLGMTFGFLSVFPLRFFFSRQILPKRMSKSQQKSTVSSHTSIQTRLLVQSNRLTRVDGRRFKPVSPAWRSRQIKLYTTRMVGEGTLGYLRLRNNGSMASAGCLPARLGRGSIAILCCGRTVPRDPIGAILGAIEWQERKHAQSRSPFRDKVE